MTLFGHCPMDSNCSVIGVFHQEMNSENFNCHIDEMHTLIIHNANGHPNLVF
jgi:hypothetical protein